jgi:transposase
MAKQRIDMRKVRELLRLHFERGITSVRELSKLSNVGKTTVSDYLNGFKRSGLAYSQISALSDSELTAAIHGSQKTANPKYDDLYGRFSYFDKQLKKHKISIKVLWDEYKQDHPDPYEYSQFCFHYYQWRKNSKVSMHIEHKAGDKLYVDFTGQKLSYINPTTGEVVECEVFVGVLGASQKAYIEAVPSQKKQDFISANESALHFFEGVPRAIVPDCLKSAVTKADKYESEINETFNDFARHYNTAVLPARSRSPKDKSLVEAFVRHAYNQIYAPLRNQAFFSLEELNRSLWDHLDIYNCKNFQNRDYSRQDLFNEVEKEALNPLPKEKYELRTFCVTKVIYNYHFYLKEDQHYYSAPYQLVNKKVLVVYSSRTVEAYYNNKRVAFHKRNRQRYGYTTNDDHRPADHKFVSEWHPQRFIDWAAKIGPAAKELTIKILDSRPHPEQAFKTCMGLLSLAKKHDQADFLKACNKALSLNCLTYKFVKNMLLNKTFELSTEEQSDLYLIPEHTNLRGKEQFN